MALTHQIEKLSLSNKTVFLRLDLNVPIQEGKILDESRILAALPTLQYILSHTNRVCVASHLGRPKSKDDRSLSLQPVGERLAELTDREVLLVEDYNEEPVDQVLKQLGKNQFVLLENLRFHQEESNNDLNFAKNLAKGIDYYVNDAFGAIHRKHASIVGVASLIPSERRAAGYLVEKEIRALDALMKSPSPFTVVLGGSKVSDKIKLILNLVNHCNDLIIGGAMAYTFLKYQGVDVGNSLVEEDKMEFVAAIYRAAESRNVNIHLPVDHLCATEFSKNAVATHVCDQSFAKPYLGLDIGPQTLEKIGRVIKDSKTVFWNGPMGVFEWEAFSQGTIGVAHLLARCKGYTLVGGGDSVFAVNRANLKEDFSHVSTGGGASLEYLEGQSLVGLKALQES
jgi:phosphoglycerate kinase